MTPHSPSLWVRAAAFGLLVALTPLLLVIALLLRIMAYGPVIEKYEVFVDGEVFQRLRFRTTGVGRSEYQILGRILREAEWDKLPDLWRVGTGQR